MVFVHSFLRSSYGVWSRVPLVSVGSIIQFRSARRTASRDWGVNSRRMEQIRIAMGFEKVTAAGP
jgi:hypothetical protein